MAEYSLRLQYIHTGGPLALIKVDFLGLHF